MMAAPPISAPIATAAVGIAPGLLVWEEAAAAMLEVAAASRLVKLAMAALALARTPLSVAVEMKFSTLETWPPMSEVMWAMSPESLEASLDTSDAALLTKESIADLSEE